MQSTDNSLNDNAMEAQNKSDLRVVCLWPGDTWTVQQRTVIGDWAEVQRFETESYEDGLDAAREWIKQHRQ